MPTVRIAAILAVLLLCLSCAHQRDRDGLGARRVATGAEVLVAERLGDWEGGAVGLVVNHTARVGNRHLVDLLRERGVALRAIFAPEHGFRGDAGAGEKIADGTDPQTGIPIFSLYGDSRRPAREKLAELDLLIFDIQDVGARCYTYIATLGLVIEAAAAAEIPVLILDRPNPAGGDYVGGWTMEEEYMSFVGPYPIPMAHGLTIGELARMMVGEKWIDFEKEPDVRVVKMKGWRRAMKWPETGLEWIPPSPNLPGFDHAYLYLGTVLFEGTTLSEGRGTAAPFLTIGAPATAISPRQLDRLRGLSPSLRIEPVSFTPVAMPTAAPNPKHRDSLCRGIRIELLDHDFDPIRVGLEIMQTMLAATPGYELKESLYRLAGTKRIDAVISGEIEPDQIDFDTKPFLELRKPYLLY